MENDNMKGHWTGIFTQKGEETEVDFTEIGKSNELAFELWNTGYHEARLAFYGTL